MQAHTAALFLFHVLPGHRHMIHHLPMLEDVPDPERKHLTDAKAGTYTQDEERLLRVA
jgi:hypothetical protein